MLAQPVALVTGASRGIGRGISQALAKSGYAVVINYAGNEAAAREAQATLGEVESLLCQADVGSAGDRDRLVDTVLSRWERIDALVNNAGITSPGRKDILDATEDGWDRVMAVNLKGPYFLTQRVVREMIRLRDQLVHPTVVNVSSLSAETVSVNRGDYCVSKAGLKMLTQLWAARTAEYGIRVYEVRPGVITTDMTAGVKDKYDRLIAEGLTPIGRWGTPDDVGRAVAALVTGQIPYCTGDTINIDGGFHIRRL
ncbi:MAG TPA: 3-ketoacyl-ACP reductase [Gemmataceae bacterium]|jgi:NAD(P)-dependent dehydrogenase (short-subunit alcohol dehydrogenase family)